MAITLNEVALFAKDLLRESTGDTIGTPLMESYVSAAYMDWCQELHWPEGFIVATTIANTAEYTLPDTLNKIDRVYVNGQRVPATTIPLLEGDVQHIYDPSWRVLPAITVPALSGGASLGIPITAAPNFAKMVYALRGGKLILSPKPAAAYELKIECSVFPAVPASGDTLVLPFQFKDGLAYGGVYRFLLSDRRKDEASGFKSLEDMEWEKAMRWRRRIAGTDQLPAFIPQNYRGWYRRR